MEKNKMKNLRFEKAMTACGAPLYVLYMPYVESVAVGVLVNAGTRDEEWPQEAGIAHALEHMVFQGNERLPDSHAIASEIELTGGHSNAMTSKESTFYFCEVPAHALDIAVRSLGSLVNEPTFPEHKIRLEMSIIVSEIRGYNDSPPEFCGIKFAEAIYGKHPLGRSELGTEEAVSNFTGDDFRRFMKRLYRPGNFVFVVVGNVTLKQAIRAFNQEFTLSAPQYRNTRPQAVLTASTEASRKTIYERDVEQASMYFGVPLGQANAADTKALLFYRTMISGGASFPLFQEVRDKRGLCYTVVANVEPWSDYGLFYVYAGTYPDRVHEAMECIHAVIENSHADEKLFAQARTCILGGLDILFSKPDKIFGLAVHDIESTGKPRSPAEIRAEVEAQTPENVARAVEKHLLDRTRYIYTYVVPKGTKV